EERPGEVAEDVAGGEVPGPEAKVRRGGAERVAVHRDDVRMAVLGDLQGAQAGLVELDGDDPRGAMAQRRGEGPDPGPDLVDLVERPRAAVVVEHLDGGPVDGPVR